MSLEMAQRSLPILNIVTSSDVWKPTEADINKIDRKQDIRSPTQTLDSISATSVDAAEMLPLVANRQNIK